MNGNEHFDYSAATKARIRHQMDSGALEADSEEPAPPLETDYRDALVEAADKVYGFAAIMLGGGNRDLFIEALKELRMITLAYRASKGTAPEVSS